MKRLAATLCSIAALVFAFSAPASASDAVDLYNFPTPAEASNWTVTTSSDMVIQYMTTLVKNGGGRMRMEFIGRTAQGRLQPLLIIGNPAPKSPSEVGSDKAVALVNCNIHSGEIEGKEAMLIFAREVAQGKHDDLLKDLVILLNPNMNADGNDHLGYWRRETQFSPALVGTRDDGQGYNINRDMTKLEAYEARAMVEVMNEWDPVIFIDAHATNGSYMQHPVTANWGLHADTDADILKYNRDEFFIKAIGEGSRLNNDLGFAAIPYGNFSGYDSNEPTKWTTFQSLPRYTTNYAGLRNRLALLLEVYSYDPFERRVTTQYDCILGALETVAADKVKIKNLIAQADARLLARKTSGIADDDNVTLDDVFAILTDSPLLDENGLLDVLAYALDEGNTSIAPSKNGSMIGSTCRLCQAVRPELIPNGASGLLPELIAGR
jgi:hypothetical protein